MFLDRVNQFSKNLGDQVKCRSPKKLKSFIELPCVAHLKVQFANFNMNLSSSPKRDPSPSSPFRGNLGDLVKGRSPKKLKSLIEVPYIARLKVHVPSFNMNLFTSP